MLKTMIFTEKIKCMIIQKKHYKLQTINSDNFIPTKKWLSIYCKVFYLKEWDIYFTHSDLANPKRLYNLFLSSRTIVYKRKLKANKVQGFRKLENK